jgi:replicative DNA helicase
MIFSLELEKQLLAGLIKYPHKYSDISTLTTSEDFYSKDTIVHKTIYNTLSQAIEQGEEINETMLAHRVTSLGISFEDNITVGDYISSLALQKLSESTIVNVARELKKLTVRRQLAECGKTIANAMHKMDASEPFNKIIAKADKLYNGQINLYDVGERKPENIFEEMKELVEFRGNNPITEFGMMGPHKRVNELYGSLLRPGNITVICARAGVGKTQF